MGDAGLGGCADRQYWQSLQQDRRVNIAPLQNAPEGAFCIDVQDYFASN